MFNSRGFTLIEAVVAVLVGVIVVVAVGGLSERLIHHRTTTDSNSAAVSLAERQMEKLLADPNSYPESKALCPNAGVYADLCGDTPANGGRQHTTTSGNYTISWTVVNADNSGSAPFVTPDSLAPIKQITVTVTMPNNPLVYARVVSFYRPLPSS